MTTQNKTEYTANESEISACDLQIHDHDLCVALYADEYYYQDWLLQNIEYDI